MGKQEESDLVVPEVLTDALHTELAVVPVAAVADRMSEQDPDKVRKLAKRLRAGVDDNYLRLSEVMWHIYDKVLYQGWGYPSWKEYVEAELDFELSKAQVLVRVWNLWRQMPEAVQAALGRLGMTKVRYLASVLTQENAAEWVGKAEGLSTREIAKLVRGEEDREKERLDGMGTGAAADADEAKDPLQQKPVKLKDVSLMRPQSDTVERAIAKACDMAATESRGHALTMICTEFLATNLGTNDPAAYLAAVERATGWRIVAVDPQTGGVLYGEALMEAAEGATEEPSEATVVASGPSLPDPAADLAGCLAAIERATGARLVAFDRATPEVLFGEGTLAGIAAE